MGKSVAFSDLAHFTPKQEEALTAVKENKFTLYGGAMGGGKSYFLRWVGIFLLLQWAAKGHTNVRIGLFCEDYPSLKDRHLLRLEIEFPLWLGTFNKSDHEFTLHKRFGSGKISFRNLDEPGKYASSEFAAILVDELTKNTRDRFDLLRTRLRWPGIDDYKFVAGTNPGGIGHGWVKKMWLEGEFEPGELEQEQFFFIQSKAMDNPYLTQSYFNTLEGLPLELKKAFLDGDWDLVAGQFFSEWRKNIHVIPNFNPPSSWFKYRSIDYGRTAPFCCKWYAVDFDKNVICYKEYYKAGVDADINFQEVAKMSVGEEYQWTVLDAAAFAATYGEKFNKGAGETIADIAWANGVECIPSPKNRKAGWALLHEFLRWVEADATGQMIKKIPRIRYMERCVDTIRTTPLLVIDKNDNEDLDTKGEDHAADTDSYFLQKLNEGGPVEEQPKPKRSFSLRNAGQKESGIDAILL